MGDLMSETQIIRYVHEQGGKKLHVIIENDEDGKWTAYLLPSKEVLVNGGSLEECKTKVKEILDDRGSLDLAFVVYNLAKDADVKELRERVSEKLEGLSAGELQALSNRLLQAHLTLPFQQLITEGMHEKLGIVEKTINEQASIALHAHDEAFDISNEAGVMTEVLRMLASNDVDQAYKLIDEYDLWDAIAPFLESGEKVRGKASMIANVEWPWNDQGTRLPFRWALYKHHGRKIADVVKEIIRQDLKQSDVYAMILHCFAELLYKRGLIVKRSGESVLHEETPALSQKGMVVFAKFKHKLLAIIKEILKMVDDYTKYPECLYRKHAHVQTALAAFISNANLMPGPACISIRKPLPMVLKELKEKYYVSIEAGVMKLRQEYPALSKKEFTDIIQTIMAREFKHRDMYSLPKLSDAENRVVIKYKDNISSVARKIFDYARSKTMLGTWDETLEILDYIEKMFIDAMKETQTESVLINLDTAFITVSSGLAPQEVELVLVSIDEIKAELHRQFSDDIKALVSEMRGYGNVTSRNIYKTIESYLNVEEFGKISDIIPRQQVVKSLKQIYGTKIKKLLRTVVDRAKELIALFAKQNDKTTVPTYEAFTCVRQVFMDVIEEGLELIDIIYDKWRSNDKLVTRLQQQVDAIKRTIKLAFLAGKITSETEATFGIILDLFKNNFAGVFEESIALSNEEQAIASKFEPAFRDICQSEIVGDLAIVKEQGAQGELIRRLYNMVIGMSRKDASQEKKRFNLKRSRE